MSDGVTRVPLVDRWVKGQRSIMNPQAGRDSYKLLGLLWGGSNAYLYAAADREVIDVFKYGDSQG